MEVVGALQEWVASTDVLSEVFGRTRSSSSSVLGSARCGGMLLQDQVGGDLHFEFGQQQVVW